MVCLRESKERRAYTNLDYFRVPHTIVYSRRIKHDGAFRANFSRANYERDENYLATRRLIAFNVESGSESKVNPITRERIPHSFLASVGNNIYLVSG